MLGEVLAASDFAVIPVIPERAAILPTQRTAQIVAAQNLPYKILCNLVDPLRGPAPLEQLHELLDAWASPTSARSSGATWRTRKASSTGCR